MLTLIATPIGNLSDITYRAVETLRAADVVYCEDTRRTLQLLNHLDIKKTLVSCHEHNERERAEEVVSHLRAGRSVAYVSDAGMPGISDPGAALVSACIAAGLPYTVLPGASAVLTAAVLSGLPCRTFSFYGFLPRDSKGRRAYLERIAACGQLAILYESPHRVGATLAALRDALGERFPAAGAIGAALLLGFFSYGLSIFFYVRAQRDLGAARTSAYYSVNPFLGALLSFLLLKEALPHLYIPALLVMAIGAAFATLDALRLRHAHTHTHTVVHTHDGSTHTHTFEHSHPHTHFLNEEAHAHPHSGAHHAD